MLRFRETERIGGSATNTREPMIRCPKCKWQPGKHDRWTCACGHQWNTFDTRGICPACDATWRGTQCPKCNEWSLHDDWYDQSQS